MVLTEACISFGRQPTPFDLLHFFLPDVAHQPLGRDLSGCERASLENGRPSTVSFHTIATVSVDNSEGPFSPFSATNLPRVLPNRY